MLLRRLYDDMLAQASYVIACDETRQAIVIDPNRNIEQYIALATSEKLKITHVTETHIHADFVSGARDLAKATGAQLLLSGEGGKDWQYGFAIESKARLLHDGDSFMVGTVKVDVMHVPGHTPEHIVFIVTDTAGSNVPMGMLSGDFIFVGDVGRPDLLERAAGIGNTMDGMARQLYKSLQKTKSLPDHLQIWPGHGAGSACGKALGDIPSSALGYERLVNWAFRAKSEQAFVDEVLAGQPEPPKYFARMKQVNRDGPAPRQDASKVPHLSPDAVLDFLKGGGVVVDVRATADFAAGHIPGTLNIPTGTSFTNWLGSLIGDEPIVFIIGSDQSRLKRALNGSAMIGSDQIKGWTGPEVIEQWKAAGKSLAKTEVLDVKSAEKSGRKILDVRAQSEWDHEHIPTARHAFLGDILEQVKDLPKDQPLVMHCGSGSRSAIAASVLQKAGFTDVANMKGGIDAWKQAGLPVTEG